MADAFVTANLFQEVRLRDPNVTMFLNDFQVVNFGQYTQVSSIKFAKNIFPQRYVVQQLNIKHCGQNKYYVSMCQNELFILVHHILPVLGN